jgi:hypothetical protein
MQRHQWSAKLLSTVARWTRATATGAVLATSTLTSAQVDITAEVRQTLADCSSSPAQPEIKLRSTPAVQGKNTFEFAGSGPLASGSLPAATSAVRVTRELVGGHTTIVRAVLGYRLIQVQGHDRSCFVVDIPLSNPGTNEVRYIAELYDFAGSGALLSTAEARAAFDVPIVTHQAPTLSTWALIALAILAVVVAAGKLRTPNLMNDES